MVPSVNNYDSDPKLFDRFRGPVNSLESVLVVSVDIGSSPGSSLVFLGRQGWGLPV